jgi:hypothetical protein
MGASLRKSWEGELSAGLFEAVTEEMRQSGFRGEALMTKVIDHKGISYQGDLRASVTSSVDAGREAIVLEVGPDVAHAPYVQYGTRPHRAPFAPITEWARRKLGDESAWFPVWRKIERFGTPPQDFLTGPARKLGETLPERIEEVVAEKLG